MSTIPYPRVELRPNKTGWGPVDLPTKYENVPYQAFNKADKIGKIVDWQQTTERYGNRSNRYQQATAGAAFAYAHEADDTQFQLVDTSRVVRTQMQRANRQRAAQNQRKLAARERDRKVQAGYGQQVNRNFRGGMAPRGGFNRQGQYGYQQRGGRYSNLTGKAKLPSRQVLKDWVVIEDIDFAQLKNVRINDPGPGEDIPGHSYGVLAAYERSYDMNLLRKEPPLKRDHGHGTIDRTTTTDDPVMEELIKKKAGNVYGTDVLLAALMCCTRSVYSFDIIVRKFGNVIVFDRHPGSPDFEDIHAVDALTVCETSKEPPNEENSYINQPCPLAQEAAYINHNFRLQVIKKKGETLYKMNEEKVPFEVDDDIMDGLKTPRYSYKAYKYRRFNLGKLDNGEDMVVVVRAQYDAYNKRQQDSKDVDLLSVHAFNEFDNKSTSVVGDWRRLLDNQKGAVISSEYGNNGFKVSKWTIQALLGQSNYLKFGFVSRADMRKIDQHVILATEQFKPTDYAQTISLDLANAWGILFTLVKLLLTKENGRYLIMKDPEKPAIRLYYTPGQSDAESGEDDSDAEDEQEADDEQE